MAHHNVIAIQRVENRQLWGDYWTHKEKLHKADKEVDVWAWHGTRAVTPRTVAVEGIDFRNGREGMWGRYGHSLR